MNYVLEKVRKPTSVHAFANDHNFEKATFYEYYASFVALEQDIFNIFYVNTLTLLQKSDEFRTFDARNKLLSFYYTFFENLTVNRTFVLITLKSTKKSLKPLNKLSKLKHSFQSYIDHLEIEKIDFNQDAIEKIQSKALKNAAWFQFLTILKFWLEDESNSFEKTDIFIEKSINTSFDLIDTKVLKSMLDLAKFMIKEKKHFKL